MVSCHDNVIGLCSIKAQTSSMKSLGLSQQFTYVPSTSQIKNDASGNCIGYDDIDGVNIGVCDDQISQKWYRTRNDEVKVMSDNKKCLTRDEIGTLSMKSCNGKLLLVK